MHQSPIKIPKFILESKNKKIIASFMRGLFDTDGCVYFWKRNYGKYAEFKRTHHYYPIIKFSTVSKRLDRQTKILLKKIGFDKIGHYTYNPKRLNENTRYILALYGCYKLNKFFKLIGSKNPVKLSRFLLWRKIGHCPAHLTFIDRVEMLKKHE